MHPLEKAAVFIILISTLIFVHELGHYLIAKLFRVKVLCFSIGFGPKLFGFRWGETEYIFAALPLGGYVKMAGADPTEPDGPPEDRGRGFLEQPPWKRGAISLAGPAMNLLFPVLIYFAAFYFKGTELSSRLGQVEPGRPAHAAGLRPGDRILSVDGRPVRYFQELSELISPKWEQPVEIVYERRGARATVTVIPDRHEEPNPIETEVRGLIGVAAYATAPVIALQGLDSPAARAGLEDFDRIIKVGEVPVATFPDLEAALAASRGPVSVTAVRDTPVGGGAGSLTTYQTLTVTLTPDVRDGAPFFGLGSTDLVVFSVEPNTPAREAGLRRGDRLAAVDGQPLDGWSSFERLRQQKGEQPFQLTLLRRGAPLDVTVRQKKTEFVDEFDNRMPILQLGLARDQRSSAYVEGERIPLEISATQAFTRAATVVPSEVRKTTLAIAGLVTGNVSVKNLGGPIMMYQVAVMSAESGWETFLRVMGFLSINLGLMNLLPIPVLDGFHILSAGFEVVRRRPLSMQARVVATYIGLALLLGLMLLAFRNDLARMLG